MIAVFLGATGRLKSANIVAARSSVASGSLVRMVSWLLSIISMLRSSTWIEMWKWRAEASHFLMVRAMKPIV
jgi:hypothetical protein